MQQRRKIIWTLIGLFFLLFSLYKVLNIFKIGHDRSYQATQGLYDERNNTLDAVYVGGSNVHCFWEAPLGWNDRGIAVWSLATDAMPASSLKYMITEARKKQPDALYIISMNVFRRPSLPVNYVMIHRITDYMNISLNKIRQISELSDRAGIPIKERLEFLFPIIRFHSRWAELKSWDFKHSVNGLKKGIEYGPYNARIIDISSKYLVTDKVGKPTEIQIEVLTDLLDYFDREKINALFVLSPVVFTKTEYSRINALQKIVQDRGYPYWDLLKNIDESGIQTDTDFYNAYHTNVHGSIKFIDYLGKRLVEEYGFTDKRGLPGWESWDKSVELYTDVIGPYSLPIERSHEKRDYDLEMPVLSKPLVDGQSVSLSWTPSEGAGFYEIFRKSTNPDELNWAFLDSVDGSIADYNEIVPENNGIGYTYTVVPGYVKNNIKYYGKFNYTGVSCKIE